MKTPTTTILIFVFVFFQCTAVFTQDENEGQKWYCYEEIIVPASLHEYNLLSRELVELCKEKEFPYSFYTWTGEFNYQLWTPINSLNDIDQLDKAWKNLLDNWEAEKLERFRKTKVKNFTFTITMQPELTYEPEGISEDENEFTFIEWKEHYLLPDKLNEAIEISKQVKEHLKSIVYDEAVYYAFGGLGYEDPCLISYSTYKNYNDYLIQQGENMNKNKFTEDLLELFQQYIPCMRTSKTEYLLYVENLSYIKE